MSTSRVFNKPISKTSQLTNDSGFISQELDPTVPSWAKQSTKPTYTAAEVGATTTSDVNTLIASAIGNISSFDVELVQSLPTQNIKEHTIYFVPKTGETNDVYDEYIYINNTWEMIGNTQIDLSTKADKTDTVLNTTLSRGRKNNSAVGVGSFAFGDDVRATGNYSHAEGSGTVASGEYSHAEGSYTTASYGESHAEGSGSIAGNNCAHAEGNHTTATGHAAHAEGNRTEALGAESHSEGDSTQANGYASHTEGEGTIANANASHVGGQYNVADGYGPEWEEWTPNKLYHVGDKVKQTFDWGAVYYICSTENSDSEFIYGHWEVDNDRMNYVEIIGNGTADNERANARALDWEGNEHLAGNLYVGCNPDSTGGTKVLTENDLEYTTEADALKIISDFWEEEEEDEGMLVTATYFNDTTNNIEYYETDKTAAEIKQAFQSGKNVVVKFTSNTVGENDLYAQLTILTEGYSAPQSRSDYPYEYADGFIFGGGGARYYASITNAHASETTRPDFDTGSHIGDNWVDPTTGKLRFQYVVQD